MRGLKLRSRRRVSAGGRNFSPSGRRPGISVMATGRRCVLFFLGKIPQRASSLCVRICLCFHFLSRGTPIWGRDLSPNERQRARRAACGSIPGKQILSSTSYLNNLRLANPRGATFSLLPYPCQQTAPAPLPPPTPHTPLLPFGSGGKGDVGASPCLSIIFMRFVGGWRRMAADGGGWRRSVKPWIF